VGFVQVGGGKREGKNSEKIFQKSSSSLSLRGEEYAQCHLKQHRIFFFLKEKEMNLRLIQKWVMTQCFSVNLLLIN
jgi:hypothetical protein